MENRTKNHVRGGNVLLARSIRESELWTWDSEHLRLWVYLLTSVNAREDKSVMIGAIEVGYGQVLKSYRRIAEECGYTANNEIVRWVPERVRRMLDRFRDAGMVSTTVTALGTLITVLNFKRYQTFSSYRTGGLGQGSRQARDNNNHSTQSKQQQPLVEEVFSYWEAERRKALGGSARVAMKRDPAGIGSPAM